MATGMYSWSQTAASNSNSDSNINWAEGQASSSVNDSARAMMSVLAKWRDDISGVQPSNVVQTTAGSANAQTLTTNGSIAALTNGWTLCFKVGAGLTNTSACTLNVDSLGAKSIQRISGTNLVKGELVAGCVYAVTYHQPADAWILHSTASNVAIPSGTLMLFQQTSAPTGWTKQTTHNDKALRVVAGTASSGGATAFTNVFGSGKTTGNYSLVVNDIPVSNVNANASGIGASGDSLWRGTLTANGHAHTLSLDIQYVDLIIASKD